MSLTTRKLHAQLGAEIVGIDVKSVDDATFKAVVDAFIDIQNGAIRLFWR